MKSSTLLSIALVVLLGSFAAQGQTVIFNQDFDGGYGGAFGTSQYFGGIPTNYGNYVMVGGGNPNNTFFEYMDTADWGDYYAGQVQLMTVTGNVDSTAANYVLTFDAYGSQAANIQLGLQSWQGNYFGGTQLINTTINEMLAAANTWQTFSINIGSIAGANPTGATWQLNFQINSWEWAGPGMSDQLKIDNIVLTNVPEPSTFALAGLGALALLIARRRK